MVYIGILVTSTTTGHDGSVVSALASQAKGRCSIPSYGRAFFPTSIFFRTSFKKVIEQTIHQFGRILSGDATPINAPLKYGPAKVGLVGLSTPALWGACKIGLQWSINGVLIETFPLVVGSRAEGGVASKLGDETRLMTMKGGTVLDSVKILACMLGGCNIGLQWSINGVLIETFPSCSGIESRRGCGFQTRG